MSIHCYPRTWTAGVYPAGWRFSSTDRGFQVPQDPRLLRGYEEVWLREVEVSDAEGRGAVEQTILRTLQGRDVLVRGEEELADAEPDDIVGLERGIRHLDLEVKAGPHPQGGFLLEAAAYQGDAVDASGRGERFVGWRGSFRGGTFEAAAILMAGALADALLAANRAPTI